jgi:hypothetical protein
MSFISCLRFNKRWRWRYYPEAVDSWEEEREEGRAQLENTKRHLGGWRMEMGEIVGDCKAAKNVSAKE